MPQSAPPENYSLGGQNSWSIIAETFLDTSHDVDWYVDARAELARRGIKGFNRYLCVGIAGAGLWWNIFWWEWALFTWKHLVYGWTLNAVLILSVIISVTWHWYIGVPCFFILGFLARSFIYKLWKGTLY